MRAVEVGDNCEAARTRHMGHDWCVSPSGPVRRPIGRPPARAGARDLAKKRCRCRPDGPGWGRTAVQHTDAAYQGGPEAGELFPHITAYIRDQSDQQ
jgi:hypothetical protein